MDNPSCASCRKGLSLEEIERGGFQHIGGRLYCAECVAKMRRKGPTRCPVCQTVDTPLYTGTTYVCRKCGADLTQKPATAPAKTRAAATESAESPRKKPTKQCPYCGGVLAAQALRCRYCGSALTREAHDLGATARQNLRLRFWLGCLLGASVLLLVFLVYALTRKAEPSQARDREQAAAAYAELEAQIDDLKGERRFGQAIAACRSFAARHPDSPEAKRARKLEDALRTELRAAREHLAASFHKALGKGDLDAAEQSVAELARSHATDVDDGLHALIAMDLALSRARANSVERGLEAKLAELTGKTPEPKAAVKGSATKTDNQDDERRAKAAAAAYEQLTAKLGGLKEARRYGEAIAACQQFLKDHADAREAKSVEERQEALRTELGKILRQHTERVDEAIQKKDFAGAGRIIDELAAYKAPEIDAAVAQLRAKVLGAEAGVAARQPDSSQTEQAAVKAYAAMEKKLGELKTQRQYGDALKLCREFAGKYIGTHAAKLVQDQQKALSLELKTIRDEHAGRFRAVLAKRDFKAARQVIADLDRFRHPDVYNDVKHMRAEANKAETQPGQAITDYLKQWEAPPDVENMLRELRAAKGKDWTKRGQIIAQLTRRRHSAALGGLIQALHDPEWYVVVKATKALAEMGDPIALHYVAPLTNASWPVTYTAAAEVCEKLAQAPQDKYAEAWRLIDRKKVSGQLLAALRRADAEASEQFASRFQIPLIRTLAHLGLKEVAPQIRAAVKTKDPVLLKEIEEAVRTLTGKASPPEPPAKPAPRPKPSPKPKPDAPPAAPPPAKPAPNP